MKHTIYSICCTIAFLCVASLFVTNSQAYIAPTAAQSENNKHDWECNYIIHDHYHGFIDAHYVNSYEELVSGGIKFTSHDGNTYQIPYPYFTIEGRQ